MHNPVAIVQPGRPNGTSNRLRGVDVQISMDVTQSPAMVLNRLACFVDVFVEGQILVQPDPKAFDVVLWHDLATYCLSRKDFHGVRSNGKPGGPV